MSIENFTLALLSFLAFGTCIVGCIEIVGLISKTDYCIVLLYCIVLYLC